MIFTLLSPLSFSENYMVCPYCQDENILAVDKDMVLCQKCQEIFRIPKKAESQRQLAHTFFTQAQLWQEEGDFDQALHDLNLAREIFESILVKRKRDNDLLYELSLVYFSLGGVYSHVFEEKADRKAIANYRKALSLLKQCKDREKKEQIELLKGMIYDSIFFLSNDVVTKTSSLTGVEKAIQSFEKFLSFRPEFEDYQEYKDLFVMTCQMLQRDLWAAINLCKRKNLPEKAGKYIQSLIDLAQKLEQIDPEDTQARAAAGLAHLEMASLFDHFSAREKLQRSEEKQLHLKQARSHLDQVSRVDQLEYLESMGFSNGDEMIDILHEELEPKPASIRPDVKDDEISMEENAALWDKNVKEITEPYRDFLNTASRKQAEKRGKIVLEQLKHLEMYPPQGFHLKSAAVIAFELAYIFKGYGYQKIWLDLMEEAISLYDGAIHQEVESRERDIIRQLEASLCYELGAQTPEHERQLELIDLAVDRLHEIEEKEHIYDRESYGDVMFLKYTVLKEFGKAKEAREFKQQALDYLGEEKFKEMERIFDF